jgi:hypothetical protein
MATSKRMTSALISFLFQHNITILMTMTKKLHDFWNVMVECTVLTLESSSIQIGRSTFLANEPAGIWVYGVQFDCMILAYGAI